jgi:DNA-binding NarL/FixJ family response regulator
MIRVLVADDHNLFRDGLTRILDSHPDIEVVASVSSGEAAVAKDEELNPDVFLLDVNMPGIGGVGAIRALRERNPEARVLMLTVSEKEDDLFTAVRVGARGYLLKDATSEQLIDAIRRVHAGEAVINPVMAAKLFDQFSTLPRVPQPTPEMEELTDRERQILHLLTHGMSNKEIGEELSISPYTVKAHLHHILEKLNLRSRVEAAAWAVRHGLTKRKI